MWHETVVIRVQKLGWILPVQIVAFTLRVDEPRVAIDVPIHQYSPNLLPMPGGG